MRLPTHDNDDRRRPQVQLGPTWSLWQARTLDRLGAVQAASSQPEAACTTWRQALGLFEQLGAPEARTLAERLTAKVAGRPHQ